MSNTDKYRTRLINLLKELFQLDQPELDFGFYKIMHAKSVQITHFLENDLLKTIQDAFGEADENRIAEARASYEAAIEQAKKFGAPNPEETDGVKEAKALYEQAKDGGNAESEVYDHLYRFFERYYDNGDFMSRRYYARESDSRAAPYAVPYDGREVYLHWANKDQYYIKSSEYLSNYSFDLNAAIRQEAERQAAQKGKGVSLETGADSNETALKIHFRIVAATEGEHGNIKATAEQKRFFIIAADKPVEWLPIPRAERRIKEDAKAKAEAEAETNTEAVGSTPVPFALSLSKGGRNGLDSIALQGEEENRELIINFQYRNDPEKTGQDNKWQETRLQQAEAAVVAALQTDPSAARFLKDLTLPAPTGSNGKRTLLGKHLQKYAARNTMDYFIHKDLGGFLRRELDFYIKNEIMRLDDIENADAPQVEHYLGKIRVLRRIARQLIAFLAQLEEFQKKLWLKKKFVTESHYCITLDRIPESFYAEIAGNDQQRLEWVKLFAINEITQNSVHPEPFGFAQESLVEGQIKTTVRPEPVEGRVSTGSTNSRQAGSTRTAILNKEKRLDHGYSEPLTVEFLAANPFLLVDTALFTEDFKHRLLAEIPDLDAQCDGVLIHSENFQALGLMQQKYREQVKCIYIDPPYNTGEDGFIYKDGYCDSTWLSSLEVNLTFLPSFMQESSSLWINIDDNEAHNLKVLCDSIFGKNSFIASNVWQKRYSRENREAIGDVHDYIFTYSLTPISFKENRNKVELTDKQAKVYTNPNNDPKGKWRTIPLTAQAGHATKDQFYEIQAPGGKVFTPPAGRCWGIAEATFKKYRDEGRIYFGRDNNSQPNLIRYLSEVEGITPWTWWPHEEVGNTDESKKEFYAIIGKEMGFDTPKPSRLLERIIHIAAKQNDNIFDYFAGSGTTAHAIINLNREDNGNRKYTLVEMGNYFDTVLKPRIQKVVYSKDWKDGKPISRQGISHCFKYLRLESYEDVLNNLVFKEDAARDAALADNPDLRRDYLLNYFLDVETHGSQSLLNVAGFRDPTAYKMQIKKPGDDEQSLQSIDLVETFNWLIGLWVRHIAAPITFSAEFVRELDPDLPKDQNTRLLCTRLKPGTEGDYWFRLIEGYTLKIPGDNASKVPTLIVWRKLTADPEKDNAVLQKYLLEKLQISPREHTYGVIYINGSHTLPNPVVEGEQTKVQLIEEVFHAAMWARE